MKYTWEPQDFRVGRRVWSKSDASNCEAIIGYNEGDDTRYCIVSQADGMVYVSGLNKAQMINWLNNAGYRPTTIEEPYMKYRLAPLTEDKR